MRIAELFVDVNVLSIDELLSTATFNEFVSWKMTLGYACVNASKDARDGCLCEALTTLESLSPTSPISDLQLIRLRKAEAILSYALPSFCRIIPKICLKS